MKQKRLMLLGGLRYLIPVIEAAHKEGYYVITCDYIPDNIAHKYSDEYHNVSIVDKEAVLEIAKKLRIDGIMSFAVDPGVVAASYVAEKMGLPFGVPYESAIVLQNKDLFRKFLADNGFNVPVYGSYDDYGSAVDDIGRFNLPVIVKPVDSAGSKGVTRIDDVEDLEAAFSRAVDMSISGKVIIEEFIENDGYSSDSDCFSVDGRLTVATFSNQYFDENAECKYTPAAYSWPAKMGKGHQTELVGELQRLIKLLNIQTSIYNIETRVGKNGKPYIMEVSPRGGGNRLAEMIRYGSGVDMIGAYVRAIVGDPVGNLVPMNIDGFWAEIILHADRSGKFEKLEIAPEYEDFVVEKDVWVREGESVKPFIGANDAVGTLVLRFPTSSELDEAMSCIASWCKILVK